MERFWKKNDSEADTKYRVWCEQNPNGYVFNYFKGTDKSNDMNVLHIVSCSMLNIRGQKASYEKVCSNSKAEIELFANEERGKDRWICCSYCFQ